MLHIEDDFDPEYAFNVFPQPQGVLFQGTPKDKTFSGILCEKGMFLNSMVVNEIFEIIIGY